MAERSPSKRASFSAEVVDSPSRSNPRNSLSKQKTGSLGGGALGLPSKALPFVRVGVSTFLPQLRSSLLGNTVRGLRSHPDAAVAAQAVAIVDAWKGRLRAAEKAEKKMVQSGAAALVAHLARGASSPAVEVQ